MVTDAQLAQWKADKRLGAHEHLERILALISDLEEARGLLKPFGQRFSRGAIPSVKDYEAVSIHLQDRGVK
jgi:hypothetical protein